MKTKNKAKNKSKYYYYFVYYVKLVKHMKCYNSLRMIIYELTAIGQSELGTVTSCETRRSISSFFTHNGYFKRRQQNLWFFLD